LSIIELDCKGPLPDEALNDGEDKRVLASVYEGGYNMLIPEELCESVLDCIQLDLTYQGIELLE
jgi:hypothetical protein